MGELVLELFGGVSFAGELLVEPVGEGFGSAVTDAAVDLGKSGVLVSAGWA